MKRAFVLIAGTYLTAALVGRVLEGVGVSRCGCGPNCWCQRPGLSAFRWVFPWRHVGPSAEEKMQAQVT